VLFAAVAAATTAGAHSTQTPPVNIRWSGYVVTGEQVAFTRVAGTWTVPAVTCEHRAAVALSTVWVGIGGYAAGSKVLDQIGTDANCDAAGQPSYLAWFELLPDVAHQIQKPMGPGDTMSGSVTIAKENLIKLTLADRTRGWTFATAIQVGLPDQSSAEWVVEAPYSCQRLVCHQAALANFGSVRMRGISVTGNGQRGTLSSHAWKQTPLEAAPCAQKSSSKDAATGSAVAVPNSLSPDGTQFDVTWAHHAGSAHHCAGGSVGGVPDVTIG
jgi:hypothetical protein